MMLHISLYLSLGYRLQLPENPLMPFSQICNLYDMQIWYSKGYVTEIISRQYHIQASDNPIFPVFSL